MIHCLNQIPVVYCSVLYCIEAECKQCHDNVMFSDVMFTVVSCLTWCSEQCNVQCSATFSEMYWKVMEHKICICDNECQCNEMYRALPRSAVKFNDGTYVYLFVFVCIQRCVLLCVPHARRTISETAAMFSCAKPILVKNRPSICQ